ncbi:MAG: efflux transporter outer membrane subunit [Rhizobiales bacterium]|nr:efflux transporter outer membrane subunit [Hyphomicrobiales bacterium]
MSLNHPKSSWLLRGLAGLVAALTVGGCLPALERPALGIAIPDHYVESSVAGRKPGPAVGWWRGFRSRPLTRFVEEANVNNLDIAVAVALILQADAQVGIAGAPLFPSLTGNGTAERMRSSSTPGTAASTRSLFALGLSASYMLDFWGKNRSGFLAAEENALAQRFNRDVVTLTTQITVANTYFQILAARDQLGVARENLAAASRILDLVRRQFSGGTVSQLDVSQQEALVATVRASIPPLEITLRQNRAALALLLGRTPAELAIPTGGLAQVALPRIAPGLPSELLVRRPDVRMAEAQLESARFSVEAARAAMLPQIQLTGTTGVQSNALQALFAPGAWYYTAIASLTQPIFDGFLLRSQLELAKGVREQDLQAYRKAILSAFADVEKALVAVQQTSLQYRLQGDVAASSRAAFRIAEQQLSGGTASLVSVLQAQQTLFTAESTLAQVRLSRALAVTSLIQALGGGWDDEEIRAYRPHR